MNASTKYVLLTSSLSKVLDSSLNTCLSRLDILSIASHVKNWQIGVLAETGTLLNKLTR
jgi:hypothetical protein